MKQNPIFLFLIALCAIALACSLYIGYYGTKSHETSQSIEYASETNEKFYQQMVGMERNTQKVFDGFPTCLTGVFYSPIGAEILTTPTDTLYFADRDLDRSNPNKYPYYVVKDNHGNIWSIFRHNDKYRLIREDETIAKCLLVEDSEKQDLN